jgi:hypothetical protein
VWVIDIVDGATLALDRGVEPISIEVGMVVCAVVVQSGGQIVTFDQLLVAAITGSGV